MGDEADADWDAGLVEWGKASATEAIRDAVPGAHPGRGGANACHMPVPETEPRVAAAYAAIRRTMIKAHCADGRDHHRCAGSITITRESITLNCPRCGDLRKTLEER